jgi:hypothetical protein
VWERLSFADYLSARTEETTRLVGRINTPISGDGHYLLWAVEAAAAGFGGYWGWRKWLTNARSAA